MADHSAADKEIDQLLSSLDAEFGKKPKEKRALGAASKDKGALDALSSARGQLTRMDSESFSEWELRREMLLANEISKHMDLKPSWIPEAKVIFCIRQHCETCGNTVEFIGGEFIRFRSKRERAVITRRAEVCTDLWHYGYAGRPLPEQVDHYYQVVNRCPGCIKVEQIAIEIWDGLIEPEHQLELPTTIKETSKPEPMTGEQLRAFVQREEFGKKRRVSVTLDIDLT